MLRTTAFVLLSAFAVSSMAASFDCTKASNYAEQAICNDMYLSGLDDALSHAYREAKQVAVDQGQLLGSQRAWMQARNACSSPECVGESISARISELNQFVRDQNELASIAKYQAEVDQMMADDAAVQAEIARQAAQAQAMEAQLAAQAQADAAAHAQAQSEAPAQAPAPVPAAAEEPVAESGYQYPVEEVAPEPQPYTDSQPAYTPAPAPSPASKNWLSFFFEGNAWKYTLLTLLATVGTAMVMHHRGSLTVYLNYTDALVTNALPVAGMVFWALLAWLDFPSPIPSMALSGGVLLAAGFGLISSIQSNDSAWKIVISFVAKIVLIGVFFLWMALLVASLLGSNTKYKDETRAQAAARNRRSAREAKAGMVAASVGYTFLTGWLCRYGEFTPIAECLSAGGEPERA